MSSAGVAASQPSRKWAAWRFDHALVRGVGRPSCFAGGRALVEEPSNRLAGARESAKPALNGLRRKTKARGAGACLFAPQ
jgi:hypothetical protein